MVGSLSGRPRRLITKHLKKGKPANPLGLLEHPSRQEAASSDGAQPGNRQAIKIKASKKVAFRAAKELKVAV